MPHIRCIVALSGHPCAAPVAHNPGGPDRFFVPPKMFPHITLKHFAVDAHYILFPYSVVGRFIGRFFCCSHNLTNHNESYQIHDY